MGMARDANLVSHPATFGENGALEEGGRSSYVFSLLRPQLFAFSVEPIPQPSVLG